MADKFDRDWNGTTVLTPSLAEYAELEREDPHIWYRMGCGHHENLFDAARDKIERLEDEVRRLTIGPETKEPLADRLRMWADLDTVEAWAVLQSDLRAAADQFDKYTVNQATGESHDQAQT